MNRRDWLKALRSTLSARRLVVAVVASALCACAWLPMRVDRSARAPALPGFGRSDMAITTASDAARRHFAQGMEQAYAFNEAEAIRAFKADQIQTIALAKDVDDTEPPLLAAGTRLTLGDIQLQTKRWTEAEQTFRADLADHPKSGWARRGLALSLRAQGRAAESDALRAELRRDWASADPQLLVGL